MRRARSATSSPTSATGRGPKPSPAWKACADVEFRAMRVFGRRLALVVLAGARSRLGALRRRWARHRTRVRRATAPRARADPAGRPLVERRAAARRPERPAAAGSAGSGVAGAAGGNAGAAAARAVARAASSGTAGGGGAARRRGRGRPRRRSRWRAAGGGGRGGAAGSAGAGGRGGAGGRRGRGRRARHGRDARHHRRLVGAPGRRLRW